MSELHLTEKQKELIERFGVFQERSGIPPAEARIGALLLVADKTELTFEEIYQTLQISKSAASNAINSMLNTDRLEYITRPGDRKRYFKSPLGRWQQMLANRFNTILEIKNLMAEVLKHRTTETPAFNAEIEKYIQFMEFLEAELPQLFKKWQLKNRKKN